MVTGHMKLYSPRFQEDTVEILIIEKTHAQSLALNGPYPVSCRAYYFTNLLSVATPPATVVIKCGV